METEEKVKCECGWQGHENDLVVGFYERYESSMPIAGNCPECKSEID